MKIAVFLGPTLSVAEARAVLDAEYLPPARQGDLYRAVKHGATILGLVDGYFDQVEAVAHKEVLWAMAEGVHVYGAASMGALRAAELAAFGMEGVGEIFEQYRCGELTDDDEVAITHGDAEYDYRCTSEAMVNIRATLAAARNAGAIGDGAHGHLVRAAKALFYPERAYPLVLAQAEADGANGAELSAFAVFLARGRVEQKRRDALALLARLVSLCASPPPPKQVAYSLSRTDAWETIRRRADELDKTRADTLSGCPR